MAKRRSRQQAARSLDIDDLLAVIEGMNAIRNGNGHPREKDPTENVKELVELRATHEKELRKNNEKWQDKYDTMKEGRDQLRIVAEQGRTDALRAGDAAAIAQALQTAATAALALQTQVTTSAQALAATAALNKDTTDKAIAALQLGQASSGSTLFGRETQRAEERGESQFASAQRTRTNQWIIGSAITVGLALFGLTISVGIFIATHVKFA